MVPSATPAAAAGSTPDSASAAVVSLAGKFPRRDGRAKSDKRRADRVRIHDRVVHPIDTPRLIQDPLERPRSRVVSTVTSVRLLVAAAVVHGLVILLFLIFNQLVGGHRTYAPPERVTVRIIETPAPAVEEPAEDPLTTPVPAPEDFAKPEPATQPQAKPRRTQPEEPTSQDVPSDPVASPTAPPRRIVGLELESTVEGVGPTFAVGTTRMGTTSRRASEPNSPEYLPRASAPGPGSTSAGAGANEQRAATLIPTRDAVFVQPKRTRPNKPPYPPTLKAQGVEGDVMVRVDIDASGRVVRVSVLQSSGHREFDVAAEQAARSERFSPALRDGQPVPYTLSYSYRFRIKDY